MINLGFRSPGLTKTHSPMQKVEFAVDLGINVIEPQYPRDFPEPELVDEMAVAIEKHDVRIDSMGCELPLTIPDSQSEMDRILDEFIGIARKLNIKIMFSRVNKPPEGVSQQQAWDLVVKNGRYAADKLQAAGITWSIEADPPCFVNTLERFKKCLALIDHENCIPNFDPTNLYVAGSEPLEAIAHFGTGIRSGHIKDGFFRGPFPKDHGEVPVGEGEVDYPAIFKAMLDAGINANMHIEHCGQEEQIRKAAEHIRKVLISLGQ